MAVRAFRYLGFQLRVFIPLSTASTRALRPIRTTCYNASRSKENVSCNERHP